MFLFDCFEMNREETNESFENDSSDETEQDDFYFESDHVALRGNKDYSAVLRTIAILQAQMVQATKDIDKIGAAEAKALEDPESFIKQLANGEKIDIPGSINIIEVWIKLYSNIFKFNFYYQSLDT